MPDADADRIIRSLHENHWQVSGKLAQDYPKIFESEGELHAYSGRMVDAVREVFAEADAAAAAIAADSDHAKETSCQAPASQ